MKTVPPLGRQCGVGLVEILVAIVVLSIGLLGIAALQTRALKNAESSLARSQAVMLSYFMLDAMRANRAAATSEEYDLGKTCEVVTDAGNLIAHDQHVWTSAIKASLGDHACGEIDCQGSECVVRIYWDDSRGTAGSASQMLEMRSRL